MIENYLRSLVNPAILSTIAKFYPTIQLNSVDLPELGSPIKDTVNLLLAFYRIVYQLSLGFWLLCFISFFICIFSI